MNRRLRAKRAIRSLWVVILTAVILLTVITITSSMNRVSPIAAAGDGCPAITSTTKWTEYYGYVTIDGEPAQEGTLVKVYSPRDELAGCQEVISGGAYPFLRVYGEEDTTPGMREGEIPTFKVNDSEAAVSSGDPTWHDDKDSHRVDLAVSTGPGPATQWYIQDISSPHYVDEPFSIVVEALDDFSNRAAFTGTATLTDTTKTITPTTVAVVDGMGTVSVTIGVTQSKAVIIASGAGLSSYTTNAFDVLSRCERIVIVSDNTNKMYVERDGATEIGKPEGWNTLAFDDSSWKQAISTWEPSAWTPIDPPIDRSDGADWIFDVSNDPQVWDPNKPGSPVNDIVLFRKTFELPGFGSATGTLHIAADDEFHVYVNGVLLGSHIYVNKELVGAETGWGSYVYDISPYLQAGENLIAIRVINHMYAGGLIYRAETSTCGASQVLIYPDRTPVRVGGTATVDVRVENVLDMYGADFILSIDPSFLTVVDADLIADGVQIAPGHFLDEAMVVINRTDNISGTIEFVTTLLGDMPSVTGSGTLATITFTAKISGTSPIHFQYLRLAREDGSLIPVEPQDGEIYSATTISGTVRLEGRGDHSSTSVSMGKELPSAHTGPDGSFLLIPVPPGIYTVMFTRTSYLDAKRMVTVGDEDVSMGTVNMVAGDINSDNCINLSDLVLVAAAYGSTPVADERTDVNGDGQVGLGDLVLVGKNYRRCGPTGAIAGYLRPSEIATTTTRLSLEPAAVDNLGAAFEETVTLYEALNLYGVDFEVTFDPTHLRIVDADPGVDGDQIEVGDIFAGGTGFVAVNKVQEGTIKFAATLISPTLPFTGSGEVAWITFKPRQPGVTQLNFAKAEVADVEGQTFTSLASGAVVTVTFPYRSHLPSVVRGNLITFGFGAFQTSERPRSSHAAMEYEPTSQTLLHYGEFAATTRSYFYMRAWQRRTQGFSSSQPSGPYSR